MPIIRHAWTRAWIPAHQQYPIDSMGFPIDPASDHYGFYPHKGFHFEKISDSPCLILLGDPGLGKTTALRAAFEAAEHSTRESHDLALFWNLGGYQDQSSFVNEVFRDPDLERCLASGQTVHLFLDSLDEGRLHIKTIAACLDAQLRRLRDKTIPKTDVNAARPPLTRVRLRIACRSAEWPESLTTTLRELYFPGESEPPQDMFRLIPLHSGDVLAAARAEGIKPEAFMEAIRRTSSAALAMRPVSLLMLFEIFKREGGLPASRWEVYEKGCLRLCADSQKRKDRGCPSSLSAERRRDIAGHAFFHLLFCNKPFFWRGEAATHDAELGLPESELQENVPLPEGGNVSLTQEELREVFNVGLFARQDENHLVPAHQTYAEFLACRHLLRFAPSTDQLNGLLFGADNHLVPQLQELAGWLMGKRPDFLDAVITHDPAVLLRGDIAVTHDDVKRRIVESILLEVETSKVDAQWSWQEYAKLKHAGLEDQLRPWLDKCHSAEARRMAILIARQCGLTGLSDHLALLALDQKDEYQVRIRATLTIADIGTPEAKRALRPLALGQAGDDPGDELKGYGLKAVWPEHMEAEELFRNLTPPKADHFVGSYYVFLGNVPKTLAPEHYPAALLWVARGLPQHRTRFIETERRILTDACAFIDDDTVFDSFLTCVLHLQLRHDHVLKHEPTAQAVREALRVHGRALDYVRGRCIECTENTGRLISYQICDLWDEANRFSQVISLYENETDVFLKPVFLELASWTYSWDRLQDTELLLNIMDRDPAFAQKFNWLKTGNVLASEISTRAKQNYYEWGEGRPKRRPKPVPVITEHALLKRLEGGDEISIIWPQIRKLLTFVPGENPRFGTIDFDLKKSSLWQSLSASTQSKICRVALEFLEQGEPTTRQWQQIDRYSIADHYGIDALNLLCAFSVNVLGMVPDQALEKWLPDIVGMPIWGGDTQHKLRVAMIQATMKRLPAQAAAEVAVHLRQKPASPEGHLPSILYCFEGVWTPELSATLIAQIEAPATPPQYAMALLNQLAQYAPEVGHEVATKVFHSARASGETGTGIAAGAASILASHSPKLDWPLIWSVIVSDPAFSEAFIAELTHDRQFDLRRLDLFSERALKNFYLHLYARYPNAQDPRLDGVITERHQIGDFKRYLLQHLTRRSTREAVSALEAIQNHASELNWIRYHVADARENLRRNLWLASSSRQLNELLVRKGRVFVQNGEQLVSLIMEKLGEIEQQLQGHTPRARFLWNDANGRHTPKSENDFSDYLKGELENSLKASGVILNREVEIRRGNQGYGERVDLHVDAFVRRKLEGAFDSVEVIIEVKGCWNKELKTAMKTQLLEQYLEESSCQFGIYLVGWFLCDKWDKDDGRNKLTPNITLEEAKSHFSDQAVALSGERKKLSSFVMDARLK